MMDNLPPAPASIVLEAEPIGEVFGVFNLGCEIRALPQLSLGPSFAYFQNTSRTSETQAWQFGLSATYAVGHPIFTSGWVTRASVSYFDHAIDAEPRSGLFGERSASHAILSATGGYTWYFPSLINVTFLGGVAIYSNAPGLGVVPQYSLIAGWAF